MWLLKWLLKAAIFFTLFAFALNNQHEVTVHFFFGRSWSTSLVLVVLTAFAVGLGIGALGMVPRWWKQRSAALRGKTEAPTSQAAASAAPHGL
ncbi:MAG: LapA family protein [Betaproteobacteria bacterium]